MFLIFSLNMISSHLRSRHTTSFQRLYDIDCIILWVNIFDCHPSTQPLIFLPISKKSKLPTRYITSPGGILWKRYSENFCKIHWKTHVSELLSKQDCRPELQFAEFRGDKCGLSSVLFECLFFFSIYSKSPKFRTNGYKFRTNGYKFATI